MSRPKIVVAGAGFVARAAHLPGYRAAGAPVDALCARNQERARMLAQQYEIPRVYSDWHQMLAQEKPDVVSVCLPNVLHYEVTLAALDAGAHVLCEKPLATSAAEARTMFDAAHRNGRHLMAAFHYRFDAAAQAIKEVVESGALGEIYYSEATALRRMGIPTWGAFHQRAFSGGGCLLDYGVHALDQTLWLVGNPKPASVSAVTQRRFGQRPEIAATWGNNAWDPQRFDVEDFAVAFVRFQDGSSLVLRASWAAHIAQNRFSTLLLGTEGGATTEPPTIHTLRDGKQVSEELSPPWRNPYEAEVAHFLAVVRGEAQPLVKEDETMNVQRILDAAYRSAEEGREVQVEG